MRRVVGGGWSAMAVLIGATVVGGALRVSGVTWGSPFLLHPDERGFVMWEAAAIEWRGLREGDFRPQTTTYGPVVYELALGLKWLFLGGLDEARGQTARYDGAWPYVEAGLRAEQDAPFSFLRWTHLLRLAGALGSALAIAMLGLAAWNLDGPRAGAWTAGLAATCVGLLQASHFATTDSLVLVWTAMLLHAAARMARGAGPGAAVHAGVALGLIAATKLTGLLLLAVLPVALATDTGQGGALRTDRPLGRHWVGRTLGALTTGRFWIACAVMLAVYAALCPWAFFERAAYLAVPENRSGRAVFLSQYTDHDYPFWDWRFPYNGTVPYAYLLTHVLPYAVGVPVLLGASASMLRGLRKDGAAERFALAAAAPTFLLVGAWGVKTIRYAVPIVPGLLLAAGLGGARAWTRGGVPRALAVAVALAAAARGIAFSAMFWQDDPRVLAGRWLRAHARAGDVVVVGPEASYTAPLGTNDEGVGREGRTDVTVRRLWQGAPADVPGHVEAMLRGARFVVVDGFYLRRAMHPEAAWRAPEQARFYRALMSGELGFEVVADFPREPRLGPFRWDESDAEILAVAFDHLPMMVLERRLPPSAGP